MGKRPLSLPVPGCHGAPFETPDSNFMAAVSMPDGQLQLYALTWRDGDFALLPQ